MDLASEIAGLVGLASVFAQGAVTIYKIGSRYRSISEYLRGVVDEADALLDILRQTQQVLIHTAVQSSLSQGSQQAISKLTTDTEEKLRRWLQELHSMQSEDGTRKRLKLAVSDGKLFALRCALSAQRESFIAQISVLSFGIVTDSDQALKSQMPKVLKRVEEISDVQSQILSEGRTDTKVLQEALQTQEASLASFWQLMHQLDLSRESKTSAKLDKLDAALSTLAMLQHQKQSAQSSTTQQPRTRTKSSAGRFPRLRSRRFNRLEEIGAWLDSRNTAADSAQQFVKVVVPTLSIHESKGRAILAPQLVIDHTLENLTDPASISREIAAIYNMRLLLRLLRTESFLNFTITRWGRLGRCNITRNSDVANLYVRDQVRYWMRTPSKNGADVIVDPEARDHVRDLVGTLWIFLVILDDTKWARNEPWWKMKYSLV
ncbi:MAG: hypothetical protein MMC23_001586 [Stictis urceolatum]|nr:hypothetical protein [Stictis urceolata]